MEVTTGIIASPRDIRTNIPSAGGLLTPGFSDTIKVCEPGIMGDIELTPLTDTNEIIKGEIAEVFVPNDTVVSKPVKADTVAESFVGGLKIFPAKKIQPDKADLQKKDSMNCPDPESYQ